MTFREVETEYRQLRNQLDAGQLTEADLRARLEELMLEDNQGRWWIIGYETGLWYVHDGEQWVQGVPPAVQAETTIPPAVAGPVTPVTHTAPAAPATPVIAKPPAAEPSQPPYTPPVQAVQPSAEGKRRFPVLGAVLGLAVVAVLSIAIAMVLRGGGNSGTIAQVTPDNTATVPVTEPAVVADTPTTESTAVSTDTPQPPTLEPTNTPEPSTVTPTTAPVDTPTDMPTDTPEPPTLVPTATLTPAPVVTRRPILTLRPAITLQAPVITQRLAPGVITDFEAFGTWARGNEPYGTFTQSKEQVHGGQAAAKLAYDFAAVQNNYVVFQARPAIAIAGEPTAITLWVYGDNSGHFINAWVSDSQGEVRQFTFGQIRHTGWQAMTAKLDVTAPWPQGQISRAGNGRLDYPVSLYAFVLDGVPDGTASAGTIYLDDLSIAP
jgi:hypothetical protein